MLRHHRPARAFAALLLWMALVTLSSATLARPGGGHRYSDPPSSPPPYTPPPYSPPPSRPSTPSSPWSPSTPSSPSSPWSPSTPDSSPYSPGSSDGPRNAIAVAVTSPLSLILIVLTIAVIALLSWLKQRRFSRQWESGLIPDYIEPPRAGGRPGARAPARQAMLDKVTAASTAFPPSDAANREIDLEAVRDDDPDFSRVLFEDFLYALYAAFQEARAGSNRQRMRAYLTPALRDQIRKRAQLEQVRDIVIGSLTFGSLTRTRRHEEAWFRLEVSFEANFTEVTAQGEKRYYVHDTWTLARRCSTTSRPADRIAVSACPTCGGSLAKLGRGNVCQYCNNTLDPGHFDWAIEAVATKRTEQAPELAGEVHVEEQGTSSPTRIVAGADERYKQLVAEDRAFSWPRFERRVDTIFKVLNEAWSDQDLLSVRPFLSDQLLQTQQYWIETYQRQGLRNKTERARITDIDISNVVRDRQFEAITVRVFATGLDFTLDAHDSVVSGSRDQERSYSEYWTLIRGQGVTTRAGASGDDTCPNCGAELDINMAGSCAHCAVRLTRGEFDWVLSRIEQD